MKHYIEYQRVCTFNVDGKFDNSKVLMLI